MITNKIIHLIITITSVVVIPLQMITTSVLGLVVSLTFGLLLLPISFIWLVLFLGPLLGLSYLYEKIVILRPITSILGIPFSTIGHTYVALMPSMGEMESRYEKLITCETFPYTWRYFQLLKNKDVIEPNDSLTKVLREISKTIPLKKQLDNLRIDVVSRPYYVRKNYQLDW